jgi:hypothetical protein
MKDILGRFGAEIPTGLVIRDYGKPSNIPVARQQ